MSKIKVSELFYSLQGEGQYVGVPSVFLRTFGCNFSCSGFGMKRGELSTERNDVAENINKYSNYKNLPLVSTGCDSYASWDPRFKHLSPMLSVGAIVNQIQALLPDDGKFSRDKHLIITGGEPLLGWQRAFPVLLEEMYTRNMKLSHLTFETNGSQLLQTELRNFLVDRAIHHGLEVTFSVSAKLPSSGEKWEEAIKPDVVFDYGIPGSRNYLKFVVSTQEDIADVNRAVDQYRAAGVDIPVYLMPVGGVHPVYDMNERTVADFCRDNGYRFSPRIQVPLYKNEWGT
jgi:organic radical activating enzyme